MKMLNSALRTVLLCALCAMPAGAQGSKQGLMLCSKKKFTSDEAYNGWKVAVSNAHAQHWARKFFEPYSTSIIMIPEGKMALALQGKTFDAVAFFDRNYRH